VIPSNLIGKSYHTSNQLSEFQYTAPQVSRSKKVGSETKKMEDLITAYHLRSGSRIFQVVSRS